MIQVIHISDLHLWVPGNLGGMFAWLSGNLPFVHHVYTFADEAIKFALPMELNQIAAAYPTILALTGDIAAWPNDHSSDIEGEYYTYIEQVRSLLPHDPKLALVLGNHDWGNGQPFNRHDTHFLNTSFQRLYNIATPRCFTIRSSNVKAVFFLIDSNEAVLPATGRIDPDTLDFLRQGFDDGRQGRLLNLSTEDFNDALKILLLHHPPLPYTAYTGVVNWSTYHLLELINAPDLMSVCGDYIDLFLFGHIHIPIRTSYNGFVMIGAGTTLGTEVTASSPTPNLQRIRISNSDTINVESFFWKDGAFLPDELIATFRRGLAPFGVRGSGRWERVP